MPAPSRNATSATDDQYKRDGKFRDVPSHRVAVRPTPQAEVHDPRAFQIGQVEKRFSAQQEVRHDGAVILRFGLRPSDPDFPFDIETLECAITVPVDFPQAPPQLHVSNGEMERGYQLNVEHGFAAIWRELRQKSLLNAMKLIDRRLESLLITQKAEIITIVTNARHASSPPIDKPLSQDSTQAASPPLAIPSDTQGQEITQRRVDEARAKREADVQQLKQRLGRDPLFKDEANGTIFTIPLRPRKVNELPADLRSVNSVRLIVPNDYDIEPPNIELVDVHGGASDHVEQAFTHRARQSASLTLLAHVNNLAQNMHLMAAQNEEADAPGLPTTEQSDSLQRLSDITLPRGPVNDVPIDTDKGHVKLIPRPPEWDEESAEEHDEDDYDSDGSSYSYSHSSSGDVQIPKQTGNEDQITTGLPREAGILMSFPNLELYNVELLELASLSVSVKCGRCKEPADVSSVKPNSTSDPDGTTSSAQSGKTLSCKKCSLGLYVGYRPDLVHAASQRAGYLDLEGCDPIDLLPSTFLPTCANCSTTHPSPGVVSVRGASDSLAICRGCHGRMLFKIPEVRFLRVGPAATNLPLRVNRPKQREKLGIVPGTELPARGACKHYAKSFRWFRFGCCAKVYACDKCHDEAVNAADGDGHPQEFANRMICGFCSREQIYKPRDCGYCGKGVTGRTGTGFWEGGKGTRDPKRMSKKDPRKWRMRKKQRQKAIGGRAGGAKNA